MEELQKLEELNNLLTSALSEYKNMLKTCNKVKDVDRIKALNERILELQELLESEE